MTTPDDERARQFRAMLDSPEFKAAREREIEKLSESTGIPADEIKAIIDRISLKLNTIPTVEPAEGVGVRVERPIGRRLADHDAAPRVKRGDLVWGTIRPEKSILTRPLRRQGVVMEVRPDGTVHVNHGYPSTHIYDPEDVDVKSVPFMPGDSLNPKRPVDVICPECARTLARYERLVDVPMGTTIACYTCDGGIDFTITERDLWQRPADRKDA